MATIRVRVLKPFVTGVGKSARPGDELTLDDRKDAAFLGAIRHAVEVLTPAEPIDPATYGRDPEAKNRDPRPRRRGRG